MSELTITVIHKIELSEAVTKLFSTLVNYVTAGNENEGAEEETGNDSGGLNLPGQSGEKKTVTRRTKAQIAEDNIKKAMQQAGTAQIETKQRNDLALFPALSAQQTPEPVPSTFNFQLPAQPAPAAAPAASLSDVLGLPGQSAVPAVPAAPAVTHFQARTLAGQKIQESNNAKEPQILKLIEEFGATSISTVAPEKLDSFYLRLSAL